MLCLEEIHSLISTYNWKGIDFSEALAFLDSKLSLCELVICIIFHIFSDTSDASDARKAGKTHNANMNAIQVIGYQK